MKKPGDEEKPLKADSSVPESKEARLKAGVNERKSYETPKDQEQWQALAKVADHRFRLERSFIRKDLTNGEKVRRGSRCRIRKEDTWR